MEKFEFYVDRKISEWVREHHIVEAETYEDAEKEMIELFQHDLDISETFDWQETIDDTREYMEPGENGGYPTAELIDSNTGDTIIDNIK